MKKELILHKGSSDKVQLLEFTWCQDMLPKDKLGNKGEKPCLYPFKLQPIEARTKGHLRSVVIWSFIL